MKNLIHVTVEILERDASRTARIAAPSIARALVLAKDGKPERRARILFPIDPGSFFAEGEPAVETPELAEAA